MCPVVFAYFMNREDIGMVQSRSGAGFLLKTIQAISVRRKLLAENFIATFLPNFMSSARYTSPIPPAPSFSRIR